MLLFNYILTKDFLFLYPFPKLFYTIEFVNPDYYEKFIVDRKDKDDFFTDRESAILFGVPSNLIEGILVGREYEKDQSKLKEIKQLIPNAYICNLDGKVIIK